MSDRDDTARHGLPRRRAVGVDVHRDVPEERVRPQIPGPPPVPPEARAMGQERTSSPIPPESEARILTRVAQLERKHDKRHDDLSYLVHEMSDGFTRSHRRRIAVDLGALASIAAIIIGVGQCTAAKLDEARGKAQAAAADTRIMQSELAAHEAEPAHELGREKVEQLAGQVGALNASIREWRKHSDADLDDIKKELRRARWRAGR